MISLHTALVVSISAFFAILFLQSGFDKIIDWKGNYEFHTSHFANSPLRSIAGYTLVIVTVMEVSCGLLAAWGLFYFLLKDDAVFSFYACGLANLNFLSLFFGQRISKDYKGAATIVPYFLVSLVGLYVTFS
jgi:hypothetical protein